VNVYDKYDVNIKNYLNQNSVFQSKDAFLYRQIIYENGGNVINLKNKYIENIKINFNTSFETFFKLFKETLLNNNFLHLDIKPDNILWNNNNNKLLLIDFGLSASIKNIDEFLTNNINLISQPYMFWCPEFYIVTKIIHVIFRNIRINGIIGIIKKSLIRDIIADYCNFLSISLMKFYKIDSHFKIENSLIQYYNNKLKYLLRDSEFIQNPTKKYIYTYFLKDTLITSDLFSLALYYLIINKTIIKSTLPKYITNLLTFNPVKRLAYMNNSTIKSRLQSRVSNFFTYYSNKKGGGLSTIHETSLSSSTTTSSSSLKSSITTRDIKTLHDAKIKALENAIKQK
jgi:serine/threonine protein kinase